MPILCIHFTGRRVNPCRLVSFLLTSLMLTAGFVFADFDAMAQGNLLVTPRRVVFEGNKRSFDLNLANVGNDSATYAISVVQIKMTDDGGFVQITEPEPGQKFADRFIRFFPRQVTLAPNESQLVKVQLMRSPELVAGEYRSHFYFRAVSKPVPLGEQENLQRDTSSISVKLTPIFGITIPVIIRIGESDMKVSLSDARMDLTNDTLPVLHFTFNRSGAMSVYGDLKVDHVSDQGKVTRVGIANGVAVYTPNTIRRFSLFLNRNTGVNFRTGRLRITYSAPSDLKQVKYAETEILLN